MIKVKIDLTGEKFERLTVIKQAEMISAELIASH